MRKPTPVERLTQQLLDARTIAVAWELYADVAIGSGFGPYSRAILLRNGERAFYSAVQWILENIIRAGADGDPDGVEVTKRLTRFLRESREFGARGGRRANP